MGFSVSDFTKSVFDRSSKFIKENGLEFKSKISKLIKDGMALTVNGQTKEQQAQEQQSKNNANTKADIEPDDR